MKILELNFERTWRGGERQTLYNMQGFRNAGAEVHLLCRKGFPLEQKARDGQFKVLSFNSVFGVIIFLVSNAKQYDVLHVQTSHILTYCLLTKPFHRRKVVFTRRVDFVPKGFFTRLKYQWPDKLVAISTAVKDIITTFSKRPDVELIPDIVVHKELNKERAEQILIDAGIHLTGKHIIGTTAAYVPHKDPLTMVEAIKELALMRDDFVFLHFGNGEMEYEVGKKIAEYRLQHVYRQMGFYENVEDLFSVLEVFVMSSEEEGLGSSVLDAFQYHVPVVSTDAGGLKDLLKEGRGLMSEVKNAKILAKHINAILDDKAVVRLMTEKAYNYAQSAHSMTAITDKYLSVIEKL